MHLPTPRTSSVARSPFQPQRTPRRVRRHHRMRPLSLFPMIPNRIARHVGFVWPLAYEATSTTSYGSTSTLRRQQHISPQVFLFSGPSRSIPLSLDVNKDHRLSTVLDAHLDSTSLNFSTPPTVPAGSAQRPTPPSLVSTLAAAIFRKPTSVPIHSPTSFRHLTIPPSIAPTSPRHPPKPPSFDPSPLHGNTPLSALHSIPSPYTTLPSQFLYISLLHF
jgi:hypothetical protein